MRSNKLKTFFSQQVKWQCWKQQQYRLAFDITLKACRVNPSACLVIWLFFFSAVLCILELYFVLCILDFFSNGLVERMIYVGLLNEISL